MEITSILDSIESRKNFLIGLIFLSKADGLIDQREIELFNNAAISLELSQNDILDIQKYWNIEQLPHISFENEIQKKFFIREAIQLCNIDNSYDESERNIVKYFANELNIDYSVVKEIEDWVDEGMRWKNIGDKLIGIGG